MNTQPIPATPTLIALRPSDERGFTDFGWLESRHSFSFGEYYDPAHPGFRSLRVINDDKVAGGGGFPSHPHRDMEIFSYVVSGQLEHKDSLGNGRTLTPGQIQVMSAGSGVVHSEYNPNPDTPVHFLQVWIKPDRTGVAPRYTEWHPGPEREGEPKVLVISGDGAEGSATIHQDARVYRIRLKEGESVEHELEAGRGAWLQVIRGAVQFNGNPVAEGDGASTEEAGRLWVTAHVDAEALLFDLA
ncbi:MAG TPA: pirin family protein [Kiritimatiellia bacterium]|nr:pirin family protein [Kiritimatiellia bacterium]